MEEMNERLAAFLTLASKKDLQRAVRTREEIERRRIRMHLAKYGDKLPAVIPAHLFIDIFILCVVRNLRKEIESYCPEDDNHADTNRNGS